MPRMSAPSLRSTLVAFGLFGAIVGGLLLRPTAQHVIAIASPPPSGHASVVVDLADPSAVPTVHSHVTRTHYVRRAAASVVPDSYVAGGIEDRTALIVGIAHAAGNTVIDGADTDAQNVRDALIKYGFPPQNIQTLLEGQATRGAVLAGLRSLAARTSRNGIAVFSVAAHSSTDSFRTIEGARVTKYEVANALGSIRGRVWSVFAMCYAGSYAVPGITGPGRVATFSSAANELTWESGSAGSDLVRLMVHDAMLDGKAPRSVESAFDYAKTAMNAVGHSPVMSDGVPGDLVLGAIAPPPPPAPVAPPPVRAPVSTPDPTPVPQPTNSGGLLGGLFG